MKPGLLKKSSTKQRQLSDLAGIGKAALKDFEILGIKTLSVLAKKNPQKLYDTLCKQTGQHHDICVLDVFACAVAQARDPKLSQEKRNWWYWSRLRKNEIEKKQRG